jgi:ABC-type transporter Mla subunit MlaD
MGQAYDQLEQMLTPDQINALSSDTQRLVQQQAQLGESLKQIGPLLNTANTMLQTLGNAGAPVTKLLDKVGSFLDSSKESGVEIDPKNVDLKALTEQAQSLAAQSQKLAQQQAV